MIEIAALATQAVASFLVPLMKEGAKDLAETLRTRTTDAAADGIVGTAKRLWERLRGKTEGTPDAATLDRFEEDPEDYQGSVEDLMRRLLKADPDFEKETRELLEAKDSGTTRWQLAGDIVGAVDARGATFSGNANVTAVNYQAGPAAPPGAPGASGGPADTTAGRRGPDGT